MLKDNIKWRGIKYFQLMRVICEELIYYIWFIYKWWEILFYFYCLIIWTFFYLFMENIRLTILFLEEQSFQEFLFFLINLKWNI